MNALLRFRPRRAARTAARLAALLALLAASTGGAAGTPAPGTAAAVVVAPRTPSPGTTAARPLPSALAWGWPLPGKPRVAHAFDPPDKPWLAGHRGVDLLAGQGSPVLAPTAAVVSFSGVVVDRPVITVATADGLKLSFEPVDSPLQIGDSVARGAQLGTLAGPTHCDGGPPGEDSCLHWGVRRGETYLNPLQFILDLRPSVLLPVAGD
jgi:murein DD-endopeptidase MepM/ murein hydrolase activator NlpD